MSSKPPPPAKVRNRKQCSADGCTNHAQNGGVCIRHGATRKRKICITEGCTNWVVRGAVCCRHGAQVKLCNQEGCTNQAQIHGVCWRHGGQRPDKRVRKGSQGSSNQAHPAGLVAPPSASSLPIYGQENPLFSRLGEHLPQAAATAQLSNSGFGISHELLRGNVYHYPPADPILPFGRNVSTMGPTSDEVTEIQQYLGPLTPNDKFASMSDSQIRQKIYQLQQQLVANEAGCKKEGDNVLAAEYLLALSAAPTKPQENEVKNKPPTKPQNEAKDKLQETTAKATKSPAASSHVSEIQEQSFPFKLYAMLEYAANSEYSFVTWANEGHAFAIHDKDDFMQYVVPQYFKQTKFRSFVSVYTFSVSSLLSVAFRVAHQLVHKQLS